MLGPQAVDATAVRSLRAEVLRPGLSAADAIWTGDDAPDTLHAAIFQDGTAVAVASLIREPYPPDPGGGDWRIRGMATREDLRGHGLGATLAAFCIEHAREAGGERVWCNARLAARGLYERAGMQVRGEEFSIEGIGPHVLMCMRLRAPRPDRSRASPD